MNTPNKKLAAALGELRALQRRGKRVFKSDQLGRGARELLEREGWLEPIIKGWLLSRRPDVRPGDTTPWFSAFWEFCARYCDARFKKSWHLSPDVSVMLQTENLAVPNNIVVYAKQGSNNQIKLPHGVSLFDLKGLAGVVSKDVVKVHGVRVLRLPVALVRVGPSFFRDHPHEAAAALASLRDPSELLVPLLGGGHSTVAGRLAGALRHIGREDMADDIVQAMTAAGYTVAEANPFTRERDIPIAPAGASPIVARLQSVWEAMRSLALAILPEAPGAVDAEVYLKQVEEAYQSDAYHSLSIEGYSVSEDLIVRIASGDWNPDEREKDRDSRDALAVRGYWQAFQKVKGSVAEVLNGSAPGKQARKDHRAWYREMFQPFVMAGALEPTALAGYRNGPVYIRGSRHTPPRHEVVPEAMDTFFTLLEQEEHAAVRAVLGHWMFVYIHPYSDGNGRMARFLMNVMLASGGYPWRIITLDTRDRYMSALETASIEYDIKPFATFLAEGL